MFNLIASVIVPAAFNFVKDIVMTAAVAATVYAVNKIWNWLHA
jgi:hypothetical protein